MSSNEQQLQGLFNRIGQSTLRTFRVSVTQFFSAFNTAVPDSERKQSYDEQCVPWNVLVVQLGGRQWRLPNDIDGCKRVSYNLYRIISELDTDARNIVFTLFYKPDLNESIRQFNEVFLGYFGQAVNEILADEPNADHKQNSKPGTTVFIIHGHDSTLKQEVQLLLNRAGVENVVLHEVLDKGRSVIDKLLEEGSNAGYAIALLSPDDGLMNGEFRARQNVILEIGFFLGMLGKSRVRMVVKEGVTIPSDLHGVLYEPFDTAGMWRVKLLREIRAAGIAFDWEEALRHI